MKVLFKSDGVIGTKKEDYPVKMNFGCFIPLSIFSLIGVIYTIALLFN